MPLQLFCLNIFLKIILYTLILLVTLNLKKIKHPKTYWRRLSLNMRRENTLNTLYQTLETSVEMFIFNYSSLENI